MGTLLSLCHFACVAATQQNATHSRTFRQARRSYSRRRCGSCPVFEVAHTVHKNALNKCSFIRLRQRRISPSRQSCETVAGVFVPARTDSKDFLRGSDCENKCGQWQPPLCLHFYFGDSHVALLLGMTFGRLQ